METQKIQPWLMVDMTNHEKGEINLKLKNVYNCTKA